MACHGGPDIIEDNLVLYLDAANTKSYPAGSATWNDMMGGNDGTIEGATYVSSSPKHFSFDGSNDYMQFDQYDFGTAFSLFAFINPTSAGTIRTLFGNTAAGGTADGITCFLNGWNTSDNKMYIEYGNGSSGTTINSDTNTITNGVWQSVTFNYDKGNNTASLYNNTTLFASDTSVTINSDLNRAFRMGRFAEGGNPYWYPGLIGVYMIYNRVLTAAEVKQNHNAFKSRFGL